MALIPAHHEVFGTCMVPESKVALHPDEWSVYDPAEHNVEDVVAYLQQAGPRERARVLELERSAAKPRKTVLGEDHETPDAVGSGDHTPTGPVPGAHTED